MELAPEYYRPQACGRTETEYIHPSLEAILSETYGVALYQEQIIRHRQTVWPASLCPEGDGLRKAMGKKLPARWRSTATASSRAARRTTSDKKTGDPRSTTMVEKVRRVRASTRLTRPPTP
jgi:DNA polymerase-3 subunit alpha